jgi:type IV pilus assembly protein PilO
MPDLRQTRKKIKSALGIMLGVDLVAVIVLLSPLVGSTVARRQELNQLWSELQLKTRQVEPLRNLPERVKVASRQISDFYEKRFPEHESQILTEFGKLASAESITISQVKYKAGETGSTNLQPVEMEADLIGNYISLAKFINSLERDQMFFIINSISLGGEQQGPVKLNMKVETYLKAATK